LRRRLRIARRSLSSLRSEKTILLAVAIQLFVAAFSSFMVVGLVSLTDPGATQGDYAVDFAVSGDAKDDLLTVVDKSDARNGIGYDSRDAALTAFSNGHVDGVLHAEYGPGGRTYVEAIAPDGDFRTTLVVVQMKDALTDLERDRRIALGDRLANQPLTVPEAPSSTPYVEFTYTVLVPMLVFLPAFISGSIAADSLAEEIERGTLELLRVAPMSTPAIVDGKALAMVGIAPAQAGLWLAFLSLNGTRIVRPGAILVLVTGLAGVLVALGAGLAIVFRTRTEAQLLYSLTAIGLFGGTMFLPENPANVVAKLAIGSATETTMGTVLGLTLGAGIGYWLVRRLVYRQALGE
jgi:ABC-2 type transport system permease protein